MVEVPSNVQPVQADLLRYSQQLANYNTAQSQAFAREQMAFQREANAKAMAFSSEQAQITRDYQERMSNTAHQREIADLIKSGLNPVLSARYGGSSTPSGATASGTSSGGAAGSVDTASSQLVSSLLGAIVNQSTALQTTAMNNATALSNAQTGLQGVLGSANINARTQVQIKEMTNNFEEYVRKNYPSSVAGGVSAIVQNFADLMTNSGTGKSLSNVQSLIFQLNKLLAGPSVKDGK